MQFQILGIEVRLTMKSITDTITRSDRLAASDFALGSRTSSPSVSEISREML